MPSTDELDDRLSALETRINALTTRVPSIEDIQTISRSNDTYQSSTTSTINTILALNPSMKLRTS